VDSDYFIAGAVIVIVGITGGNLCLLLGIRNAISGVNRRVDHLANKFARLMDFLEETEQLKRKRSA
jgi:uncharacterized membrane protein YdjX (TVP38/TMEM64 family)